jgi:two-component system, LytTR family, response regulator
MEHIISCAIIDDEPLAQELIERYITRIPALRLIGKWDNAITALAHLEKLKPELVFLDVNMPEMTGIELIRTFNYYKPQIILTTAYQEYAVQGFEYDVTDFILKPVTFERFVKSVNKVREKSYTSSKLHSLKTDTQAAADLADDNAQKDTMGIQNRQLLIKDNKKFVNITLSEIYMIEGMRDYLKIYVKGKVIITHMTMAKMEETLPGTEFLRVHRSFIVRKSEVKSIIGNIVEMINGQQVPIGTNYKDIIRSLKNKGTL